jgi:DNA ligase-1
MVCVRIGMERKFISRLGNTYKAPAWFTAGLPKRILDGELWLGRKQFQKCISIVRRQDANDEWSKIIYYVFDAPNEPGIFASRYNTLRMIVKKAKLGGPRTYIELLEQIRCTGYDHLKGQLKRVEDSGGEGLMLRDPSSVYEVGRSSTLLKVKSFHDDEAVVVGHEPGKGKHKGRLGALVVKLANGTQFSVGTGFSDAETCRTTGYR